MIMSNIAVLLKPLDAIPKTTRPVPQLPAEARRYTTARLLDEQKCALLQAKKPPK